MSLSIVIIKLLIIVILVVRTLFGAFSMILVLQWCFHITGTMHMYVISIPRVYFPDENTLPSTTNRHWFAFAISKRKRKRNFKCTVAYYKEILLKNRPGQLRNCSAKQWDSKSTNQSREKTTNHSGASNIVRWRKASLHCLK